MLNALLARMKQAGVRRSLITGGVAFMVLWLSLLDSHSLVRRVSWQIERSRIVQENEALRSEIAVLEDELSRDLTNETIERIAREEYHMRRPGETVHLVDEQE
jgi:cell division protein FtsB